MIRFCYAAYLLLFLGVFTLVWARPVAFQKSNVIKVKDQLPSVEVDKETAAFLDVEKFFEGIPYESYEGEPAMVYFVHPEDKYTRTIEGGEGNCANLSWGASHAFLEKDIRFQIVHILPFGSDEHFLEGGGHTVMRVPYEFDGRKKVGIIDLLEGGIPMGREGFLKLRHLREGARREPSILPLNVDKDTYSRYYGSFLDDSKVAIITDEEIERYFRFLETVYFSLGNERLERYVFDGLALLFGVYPAIYVKDVEVPFMGREAERFFYKAALWVMRSALVIFPLILWYELKRRFFFPRSGRVKDKEKAR